jgi:hypothetical protein
MESLASTEGAWARSCRRSETFSGDLIAVGNSVKFFGTVEVTLLIAAPVFARDGQRPHADASRTAPPHTRTTHRQRTENGHTRTRNFGDTDLDGKAASIKQLRTCDRRWLHAIDEATNRNGATAAPDLAMKCDRQAGLVTRAANYSNVDGREGSRSDVIQRTEDGFARATTGTLPSGEPHTYSVDVSCGKDVGKCVKQVEVGKQPEQQ